MNTYQSLTKKFFIFVFLLIFYFAPQSANSTEFPVRKAKKVLVISNKDNPFKGAYDIAIDQNTDTIYVRAKNKIQAYDTTGSFLFEFGDANTPDYILSNILGLWVDPAGKIYVVSRGNDSVAVFNPQGDFLFKFKTEHSPWDVITNSYGDIIVSINNFGSSHIQIFDNEGKYKYSIKKIVVNANQKFDFGNPLYLGATSDDRIFVTDDFHVKVLVFDIKGKLVNNFGGRGDVTGKFFSVTGLCVDSKNRVYVVDRTNGFVQIFTRDGEFLAAVSNENSGPPGLVFPSGIAFDSKQRLYCLEGDFARISVFDFMDR